MGAGGQGGDFDKLGASGADSYGALITGIRHPHVAGIGCIDCDTNGTIESTAELLDAVIAGVRHPNVSSRIDRESAGLIEESGR